MFGLLCLRVFATNKDKINKYRACVTDSYLEFILLRHFSNLLAPAKEMRQSGLKMIGAR